MAFKGFVKALALVGLLALAPAASAQTAGAPLQVRTGEVFTVDLAYTQSTEFGGEEIAVTMRQVYALHIVDAENRLWRYVPVSLTYELPTGLGIEREATSINWDVVSDAISAFVRIATDVGFDCHVDEYGRCIEMTNWRVWSDRVENTILMADAFARLAPTPAAEEAPAVEEAPRLSKPGTEAEDLEVVEDEAISPAPRFNWNEVREPVLRGVARLLDNYDARDAAAMMSTVYMPAFIQGRTLTRRQTVSMVDDYEMPFGAPPLRFNSTLRLERIDQPANTATIVRRSTLDPESTREASRVMTAFLSEALVQPVAEATGGEEPPSVEAIQQILEPMLSALTYEETTTGVVDLTTGMARETTTDMVFSLEGPSGREAGQTVEMRGRIVTRVTPGAPSVPRLPRATN